MLIYFSFKINQDYIANNLCENRFNPNLTCKGKCILMKKLKATEKDSNGQRSANIKLKFETPFCQYHNSLIYVYKNITTQNSSTIHFEPSYYLKTFTSGIFHPPNLV
jgi:hypothetical protein